MTHKDCFSVQIFSLNERMKLNGILTLSGGALKTSLKFQYYSETCVVKCNLFFCKPFDFITSIETS